MGNIRSLIAGLALVLSGTAGAAAADLEMLVAAPCCGGPWYLKGFLGMATPNVDSIFTSDFLTNDFIVEHHDIKSSPFFGGGIGYDTGHYLRFDITGEYRGKSLFLAQDKYPGSDGFNTGQVPPASIPARTNTRRTLRAGRPGQRLYRSRHLGLHHALHRRRCRLRQHLGSRPEGR
jgi:opacity protein-like surface antigen